MNKYCFFACNHIVITVWILSGELLVIYQWLEWMTVSLISPHAKFQPTSWGVPGKNTEPIVMYAPNDVNSLTNVANFYREGVWLRYNRMAKEHFGRERRWQTAPFQRVLKLCWFCRYNYRCQLLLRSLPKTTLTTLNDGEQFYGIHYEGPN